MNNYSYVIYQVRAKEAFAFMAWKWAKDKFNWSLNPYKSVWNGIEEARDDYDLLNYLFEKFNVNHPKGFRGHSMSVSDVVRICTCIDEDEDKAKYYYCDAYGWEDITKEVKGK